MMTDEQLIARFLNLQEHPEQVTEEQLKQLLEDEQIHELVEQMVFVKRALKNHEILDKELLVEEEWEKFATAHAAELDALDDDGQSQTQHKLHSIVPTRSQKTTIFKPLFRKYAAVFIGVLLASGIALAAIHIVRHVAKRPTPPQLSVTDTVTSIETVEAGNAQDPTANNKQTEADSLIIEPRTFDNVPLDTMLHEMAAYYQLSVEFQREDVRQLRMHFDWKPTENIDRVVERLNHFEAVNIILEPQKLIVK